VSDPRLENLPPEALEGDCWSRIGVLSDGKSNCPLLAEVVHCHNCQVFRSAGRSLFDRPAPDKYLADWTGALSREKGTLEHKKVSLLAFRLCSDWLALKTSACLEITEVRPVRTLPHRSGPILRGLVNIRGEIQMCVSLDDLLGIEKVSSIEDLEFRLIHPRMIVVEWDNERWVFEVKEIGGIRRYRPGEIEAVPSTLSRDQSAFSSGLVSWGERKLAILDEELVFRSLRRKVMGG
jgi:chemotaxis-related protein WspD